MSAFGQQIKQADIDKAFGIGPSEFLVAKTLDQLGSIKAFTDLFGPYTAPTGSPSDDQQRWADYQRFDWTIRQLPAINVFESATPESKDSDQAFLRGNISFQIFWPANFKRSDSRRVEVAFKGALQNFFSSKYVRDMLDELYYIQRPMKVHGLNEYGKTMTWTPNTNAIVENEIVPVTIIDANYRIDLRSWYRALEFMDRTKDNPFEATLDNLGGIGGATTGVDSGYDGKNDAGDTEINVPVKIDVTNP